MAADLGSCPFDGYAGEVYAALEAIGANHTGSRSEIEDALREKFAYLIDNSKVIAVNSGSIELRRGFDGDDEYGFELTLRLGTVYADEIESWKERRARAD